MPVIFSDLKKSLFLFAGKADPAPPLGTVLGNSGVNTINFCTQFNQFTNTLPYYFFLKVHILINANRTFNFVVFLPSTTYFLNLLKFNELIKFRVGDRVIDQQVAFIHLKSIVQLAKFKYPVMSLKQSFPIILGSLRSMNLKIKYIDKIT